MAEFNWNDYAFAPQVDEKELERKKEEARRMKEEKERLERRRSRGHHLLAIGALMKREKPVIDIDKWSMKSEGVELTMHFHIDEERSRISSWRSTPNDRLRLAIGTYGERKSFPQRKDGTFNYEEIARLLDAYVAEKKYQEEATNHRLSRQRCVHDLEKKYNLPNYQSIIEASSVSDVAVNLKHLGTKHLTQEKADKLLEALRELRLI